jgi:hypothetical protein
MDRNSEAQLETWVGSFRFPMMIESKLIPVALS